MKKSKIWFAAFSFILGAAVFSFWKNHNYISIAKKNTTRSLASKSSGQQLVIDDFTTRILKMRSKSDIDLVFKYIVDQSKKYPTFVGVQLFSSVALLLPKFKGIAWKLRGVVEKTDITHTYILSQLRFLYFSRYMYGPHLQALFHYLTDPPEKGTQFYKISELQDALLLNIKPVLRNFLKQSLASLELPDSNHRFSFDRRIFSGDDENKRYFDPIEAKREFIKPYMSYIISGLARTIGTIDYVSQYDLDDLTNIMRDNLRKTAINSFFGRFKISYKGKRKNISNADRSLPNIVSRKELFKIVRKYKNFLRPRIRKNMDSQKIVTSFLNEAYRMFQLASEHDLKGYVCTIKLLNRMNISSDYDCSWSFMESESFNEEEYFVVGGSKFLIDPNQLLINHRQKFHELRDRYRIYHPGHEDKDGIVMITSDVTGKTVRINAKKMFTYQKDLKKFLPISYNTSIDHGDIHIKNAVGDYNDRGQWAWNYDYGRPIQWAKGYETFGGLFPDATNENMYELMYSVRLTQSLRPFSNMFTTVP